MGYELGASATTWRFRGWRLRQPPLRFRGREGQNFNVGFHDEPHRGVARLLELKIGERGKLSPLGLTYQESEGFSEKLSLHSGLA